LRVRRARRDCARLLLRHKESRQPGLATVGLSVVREPALVPERRYLAEAQQRFRALFEQGLNEPGDMEKEYGKRLGTLFKNR
jgi:hypothetical protein